MADLRELIREIIREEIEAARKQSVSNRYKMVRVNNVLVPSAGKVYVVPVDNEATFPEIVVNRRVATVEGLEVVVGVDNTSNVRQVLDIFDGEIFDQDDYTGQVFQPLHAPDHGWTSQTTPPFNNPAVDAVSVGQRGFIPLRERPAKAGGTKIDIAPFTYEFNDSWVVYPGSTSFNLTSNVPGTSGKQQFTLVYLDKTTNTILTADGTESIYAKSIRPLFPTLPSGKIEPIALVRLYNGQSSINEAYDIYDARRVIGTAESDDANIPYRIAGAVGSGGGASQPTTADDIAVTDDVHFKSQILVGGADADTPESSFHVVGADGAVGTLPTLGGRDYIIFENDHNGNIALISGATSTGGLKFYKDAGSTFQGGVFYKNTDDSLLFRTNGNNDRLTIDSAGKVGIGDTAPARLLHVDAGGTIPSGINTSAESVLIQHNENTTDQSRIIMIAGNLGASSIDFGDDDDGLEGQILYGHSVSGVTDFMSFTTNSLERIRILNNGDVGIGTATPGSQVEINLATEDLEIVDAGSTSATEQDWIEVQVGGVTGYIRVYATK